MKKRSLMFVIAACAVLSLAAWSCSIDENPVVPSEVVEASYTVSLSVGPSTAYRTMDTWGFLVNPVEINFKTTFEAHHDEGEEEHEEEGHHGDIDIGTVSMEGYRITVIADHAMDMFHIHEGHGHGSSAMEFEEEHGKDGDFMVMVHLFETVTGHAPHGGTSIGYSNIHIKAVEEGGAEFEFPMSPVFTVHGFRYAVNASLPPGIYDLHIEAEPPTFSRLSGYESKWNDHMEAEFHEISFAAPYESGTVGSEVVDGLTFTLRRGDVGPFAALGTGAIPLTGEENIQFSLSIEDESIEPEAENVPYSSVVIRITNNETGETNERVLYPVFGSNGFHYAANFSLPGTISQQNEGDGHGH